MRKGKFLSLVLTVAMLVSTFGASFVPSFAEGTAVYAASGYEVSNLKVTQEGSLINDHQVGFFPPADAAKADEVKNAFSGWLVMYSTKGIDEVWAHLQGLTPDQISEYANTAGANRIYKITNYGWADGVGNTFRAGQRDVVTGNDFGPGLYHIYVATQTASGVLAIAEADKTRDILPTPKNVTVTGLGDAISDYKVSFESFADERITHNLVFYSKEVIYSDAIQNLMGLSLDAIAELASEDKAVLTTTLNGEVGFTAGLREVTGEPFGKGVYYVYVATIGPNGIMGISYAKSAIITADEPAPATDPINGGKGTAFAIGGATSTANYDYLKTIAGVEKPRIAVFSSSRDDLATVVNHFYFEDPVYDSLQNNWLARGFEPVYIPLAIDSKAFVANHPYYAALVKTCDVVWLQGGDQNKHAKSLLNDDGSDTNILKAIRYVYDRGGVVAGTSAGMHVMSNPVFGYGTSDVALNTNYTEHYTIADIPTTGDLFPVIANNSLQIPGIGLMPANVLNDTHFDARGRLGRLVVALRDTAKQIGVACDEGTGLAITDNIGTVVGDQGVFIVDVSGATYKPAASGAVGTTGAAGAASATAGFGVTGVRLHYLTDGDTYNFKTGAIVVREDKTPVTEDAGAKAYVSEDVYGAYETTKTILSLVKSSDQASAGKVKNTAFIATYSKIDETRAYQSDIDYKDAALAGLKKISITGLVLDLEQPTVLPAFVAEGATAGKADGSGKAYAATIKFSADLKVGYVGSKGSYLNDLEAPEYFVEVLRGGAPMVQGSSSLMIKGGNQLEIVLKTQDFADGDQLVVKATIKSTQDAALAKSVTYVYRNGAWSLAPALVSILPGKADGSAPTYSATVTLNNPYRVGYTSTSGKSYLADQEAPEFFVEIKRGKAIIPQDSGSLRIMEGNKLQIVTKTDDFAVGDLITLKGTITDIAGNALDKDYTFVYTGSAWKVPNQVTGIALGKADGSGATYAATIAFENPLRVGYVGSKGSYLNDQEAPEYFVEILRGGKAVPQGSSTLMIKDGNKLEIVLKAGDFANRDQIIIKNTITDTAGGIIPSPITYVYVDGQLLPYSSAAAGITAGSLVLTSMDVEELRAGKETKWRVINKLGQPLSFTYTVAGRPDITGTLTVGAEHTEAARFENPFYFYVPVAHPATVIITWGAELEFKSTKASGGKVIPTPPATTVPPTTVPPTTVPPTTQPPTTEAPATTQPVTEAPAATTQAPVATTQAPTAPVATTQTPTVQLPESPVPQGSLAQSQAAGTDSAAADGSTVLDQVVLNEVNVPQGSATLPQTGEGNFFVFYLLGIAILGAGAWLLKS